MYTIKSTSDEGVYYLVNHWNKYKTFWIAKDKLKKSMLFSREQDARASLKKLLKVMPEYTSDTFEIVKIDL